jgi:threonine dehydrogenase-like Zn-dependent dehydrogenase
MPTVIDTSVPQLFFTGPSRVEEREPAPATLTSPASAVVRPLAVSTCDMDAVALSGLVRFRPAPLGHEAVAEVVEVGEGVQRIRPGQRVVVPWQISCGSCSRCLRGQDAHCTSVPPGACYGWGPHVATYGGLLTDTVSVPYADHMLVPLPDGLDPAAAAGLGDNLVDAWRAVGPPLQETGGSSVLVVGGAIDWGGSIGLYAVATATALAADRVVFASQDAGLRARAEQYGAEAVPVVGTSYPDLGHGFDVTVDTSGLREGLGFALRSTGPAGTCTCTAGAVHRGADTPVPVYEMYCRTVTFRTGWVSTRPLMDEPLRLTASGALDPLAVAGVVSWADAPAALSQPFTKVVVVR